MGKLLLQYSLSYQVQQQEALSCAPSAAGKRGVRPWFAADAFGHDANATEYVAAVAAEARRRRAPQEATRSRECDCCQPHGHTAGSPTSGGMRGGASSSGPTGATGTGSNRAEKYLPNLPSMDHGARAKDV